MTPSSDLHEHRRHLSTVRAAHAVSTGAVLVAVLGLSFALPPAARAQDAREITLDFAGEFGGRPFDCDRPVEGVGSDATTVDVGDYRLYVSDVRLIAADGSAVPLSLEQDGRWQFANVALLDFENGSGRCTNGTAETNASVRGSVPPGDYTGVAFEVGVPFALNHADPTLAASPLNLTAMFWSWRGGYRFLRVDLVARGGADETAVDGDSTTRDDAAAGRGGRSASAGHDGDGRHDAGTGHDRGHAVAAGQGASAGHGAGAGHGGGRGWALHVGSARCASPAPTRAPDACAEPNRIAVRFERFDVDTQTIVVDPAAVLAGVDVSRNAPDTSPGCMSAPDDPDCAAVFAKLGLGGSSAAPQALMTVR